VRVAAQRRSTYIGHLKRSLAHSLRFSLLFAALLAVGCARDAAQDTPGDTGALMDAEIDADDSRDGGNDPAPVDTGNTLTPDSDVPSQCTRVGDACLLPPAQNVQVQNAGFVCIRDSDDTGFCHLRCAQPYNPDECRGVGGWCLDIGADEPLPVCFFDECALRNDCGADGTCLRFRRTVGLCFLAGTATAGEYCDFSDDPAKACASGLVCDDYDNICRHTCDPWGADTCQRGSKCGLFTNWTGACWPQTTTGRAAFEPCAPSGEYCDTNLLCAQIDPPPASPNCIPICQVEDPDSCRPHQIMGQESYCVEVFDDANGDLDTEVGFCLP
jgi:hypothetical protein